jgi:hypothetical protein
MKAAVPAKKKCEFDPKAFLATIGDGRKRLTFSARKMIFAQGTQRTLSSISKEVK